MFKEFRKQGKASFIIGGQWGSEGKGGTAAVVADQLARRGEAFDVYTTNAGAQAGHTSLHNNKKRVTFHLPTAAMIASETRLSTPVLTYLNAGSIIDPEVLQRELDECNLDLSRFFIHPNAAIITPECKEAEGRVDSAQTKIASTRKGVGEALSRKVLRSGLLAKDVPELQQYVKRIDLNDYLSHNMSVLVEVPQGIGLSIDGLFYPHCTSRNCTVGQAMSDAGIHPSYYGETMLVLRTYPIRVGNIKDGKIELGTSGAYYADQEETSWEALDQTPEITTVTKRVRRVFSFSQQQLAEAMALTRPLCVHLTFCDYVKDKVELNAIISGIRASARALKMREPHIVYQYGPSTDDIYKEPLR